MARLSDAPPLKRAGDLRALPPTASPATRWPAAGSQSPSVILLVEDEPVVRELIASGLARDGHAVTGVATGEEALALLGRESFDLAILDVGLPGMSGFEACRQIRERSDLPVIFVTAAGSLGERLRGFDLGADDYLVKPLEVAELGRRVRAVLRRRARRDAAGDELQGPDSVAMSVRAHRVLVHGRPVEMTPREFAVLRLLLEHQGEVLDADTISTRVWGHETFGTRNFVEAHISRLRAKLRRAGAADVVTTVRGIGYVIR